MVDFLKWDMGMNGVVVEKDNGKSANTIYYKANKFEQINLNEEEIVLGEGKEQWKMTLMHLRSKES